MTDKLKSYLQNHKAVIKAEQFDTLLELCPLNSKKELILFLLDCNENDPSIIKIDRTTKIFRDGVQVYFPQAQLVYTWLSFDRKPAQGLRSGAITYVAVVRGHVIEDKFRWSFDAPFVNLNIIAENVCEDLSKQIRVHLNDK